MRLPLEMVDAIRVERGELARERLRREILRYQSAVVAPDEPHHLRRRPGRHREPRLDALEELVGQCEAVVQVGGRNQAEPDVVPVQVAGELGHGYRWDHAHSRLAGGELPQAVEIPG